MRKKKCLKVCLLFDVPDASLLGADATQLIKKNADYVDERDVLRALEAIGHTVQPFPVYNNLQRIIDELTGKKYDLVFTMFETYGNNRDLASHLTSLFEILRIPYTGAKPETLALCKDKGLTKKILSYHGIDVPAFTVIRSKLDYGALERVIYPAIVKPLGLDASEGIHAKSLVHTAEEAKARVSRIRKEFKADAIVEQYIDGRELYIGVLAGKATQVFPPQELHFKHAPKSMPRILTYKAKWDKNYRKKYGIDSGRPKAIKPDMQKAIEAFGTDVSSALGLSGYARIDLRVSKDGRIYFIEANPNPAMKRDDDFPQSAKQGGLSYEDLIDSIVKLSSAA